MEKIKVLALKNPIFMGTMAFLLAYFISLFNTDFLELKYMSIEKTLIPIALLLSILYGYVFKTQIPKSYGIKYSITISILYVLYNLLTIYIQGLNPNTVTCITCIIMGTPIFGFATYLLSGVITESFSSSGNNIAEISSTQVSKKQLFIIGVIIFVFILLTVLVYFHRDLKILFPLIMLAFIVFGLIKYHLTKNKN